MPRRPQAFDPRQRSKRAWLLPAVVLAVLAAALWRADSTPLEELAARARQALAEADFNEVELLCGRALERDPHYSAALLL
ncbi:MAG TPA: hypothetical protein VGX78_16330, partial [Pirellulales bacterium]|nr:hypothetical protein [Pirellulales bacterium]